MRFTSVVPGVISAFGESASLPSVIAGGQNMPPYFGLDKDRVGTVLKPIFAMKYSFE